MRSFLIGLIALSFFACNNIENKKVSANSNTAKETASTTTVQWMDSSQNIGALKMGTVAQIKFRFKNTGDNPLFIISAEPGCGCTVADYPKEAIGKGEEGEIVAAFDTNKATVGGFKKAINVRTNTTAANTFLYFEGEVISKDGRIVEPIETPKKGT